MTSQHTDDMINNIISNEKVEPTEEELDTLSAIALELNNLLDGTDSEVIKVNAIIELLNAKKQ